MKKRIVVMLLSVFFSIGGFTAAGQFDLSGMSADLTDSVVSAKTQTSSSTVSVDDILQEANRIKNEQHLPIATSQDDDENSWTLAIYMCGSDLERDKAAGTRDLCEMLGAQHKMEGDNRDLDNLNLIVMTGGAGNDLWRPESVETPDVAGFVKPQGTQIWQISSRTTRKSSPLLLEKAPGTFSKTIYDGYFPFVLCLISFITRIAWWNRPDCFPSNPSRLPAMERSVQGEPNVIMSTGSSSAPLSAETSP